MTQRLIDSLQKRGADGDYQNKEMDMLLNKKPSIERLYRSLEEFGKDRKGIVYAINILMLMLLPSSTENTASRLLLLIVKRQVLYEKNL